jgi:segregation and condensation protein B
VSIKLKNIVEALIFSSDRPLSILQIKDVINDEKLSTGFKTDIKKIEEALEEIKAAYDSDEYSFKLIELSGGYRFGTKKEYSVWLSKLNKEKLKRKLSQSALETLAIIAYKQPITKHEMESIRGVNVDYIVGSLLEKNLITIKGRADSPGRPILYGTTLQFLEYIGLNSAEQLPPLKDISEIIKAGPPEGISQSDIDFYEEINSMKLRKTADGLNLAENNWNENDSHDLNVDENGVNDDTSIEENETDESIVNNTDDKDELKTGEE